MVTHVHQDEGRVQDQLESKSPLPSPTAEIIFFSPFHFKLLTYFLKDVLET